MERDHSKRGGGSSSKDSSSVEAGSRSSTPALHSENHQERDDVQDQNGSLPSSSSAVKRHRRETLLLDDTEFFAFDFGEPTEASPQGDDGEEVPPPEEDEDEGEKRPCTTTVISQRPFTTPPERALSLEEVQAYAKEALARGPAEFLRLSALHKEGSLEEAVKRFVGGLRRYDEGLWRAHKAQMEGGKAGVQRRRPHPTAQGGGSK